MQATQDRSDAHREALADSMAGEWCRGRHWANRTITAGTCKTARRVRVASHCEFATHTRISNSSMDATPFTRRRFSVAKFTSSRPTFGFTR
jgi:predicted deacetylase